MAEATRNTKTIETVLTEEIPAGVTLVLNDGEAEVLTDVLAAIAGSQQTSRRGLTEGIFNALSSAGFDFASRAGRTKDYTGQIEFEPLFENGERGRNQSCLVGEPGCDCGEDYDDD